MPRVSEEYRERRRQEIVDAARRCFGRAGYEATTIRDLERESGLSSGAIFNYFASKLEIFIAVAEEDAGWLAARWREGGLAGVVAGAIAAETELVGSYLELGRRVWADDTFQEMWRERGAVLAAEVEASVARGVESGTLRSDIPPVVLADFLAVVLDGLLLRVRTGGGGGVAAVVQLVDAVIATEAAARVGRHSA